MNLHLKMNKILEANSAAGRRETGGGYSVTGMPASLASGNLPKECSSNLVGGIVVGRLSGFTDSGVPLVSTCVLEHAEPAEARSVIALSADQIGREVVLAFEMGDKEKPIIMGTVQANVPASLSITPLEATIDGEKVILTGEKEIILRCGKSSITLTCAGKILLKGEYLLSRSSGVNRIKGGSVQIN